MKILHAILSIVLLGVALAGSACLFYGVVTGESLVAYALTGPAARLAAGSGLVFVSVVFVFTALPAARGERFISFANDGGTVRINVKAVTDFLARCARGFSGVERVGAEVISMRTPVSVLLDVHVRSGINVPETCKMLQQHVRTSLAENLGIADIGAIQVNVTEILDPESSPIAKNSERHEWHNQ